MASPTSLGYLCPKCKCGPSPVVDSRPWGHYVRRRRACKCGNRWSTVEVPMELIEDATLDDLRGGMEVIVRDLREKVTHLDEFLSSIKRVEALREQAKLGREER